jgi:flagellar basal body-associated protein FliL
MRVIIPYLALLHRLVVVLVTAVHRLSRVVLAGQVAAVVTPEQAALEILQTLRHLKEVTVEMARESRGQIMAVAVVVAHLQLAVTAATRLAAMAATAPRLAFLARL